MRGWMMAAVAMVATLAAGCDRLRSGDDSTLSLLREGSAKACAAREVEDLVRGLILPATRDLSAYDVPVAEKRAAISAVRIALKATTLESVAKDVSRVTCNAQVEVVDGAGATVASEQTEFTVSPSAQDERKLVVSADVAALRLAARAAIGAALVAYQQRRIAERDRAEAADREARLDAIVSAAWLAGRWVSEGEPSACVDGPYEVYAPGGIFEGYESHGRWSLSGRTLRVDGVEIDEPFTTVSTITAAGANTFSLETDGRTARFHRCRKRAAGTPGGGNADAI